MVPPTRPSFLRTICAALVCAGIVCAGLFRVVDHVATPPGAYVDIAGARAPICSDMGGTGGATGDPAAPSPHHDGDCCVFCEAHASVAIFTNVVGLPPPPRRGLRAAPAPAPSAHVVLAANAPPIRGPPPREPV